MTVCYSVKWLSTLLCSLLNHLVRSDDVTQVWKQKGEEYRITGQGGWFWVSVSRPSRCVAASNLGLRLVARKLQIRRLKQHTTAVDETSDQKPSTSLTTEDKKPSIPDGGCSDPEEKVAESKTELESAENEAVTESKSVKAEQDLEDVKEPVKCEDEETCKDEDGELKSETKEDETMIDVTAENATDIDDDFSVSEALISRTFYPRITKPYCKLDTFLDRRLLQFNAEQKQRALCEQLVAQFRAQEANCNKPPPPRSSSDKPNDSESDTKSELNSGAKADSASTTVSSGSCYSALCRSADKTAYCYSTVCRQISCPAEPDLKPLRSDNTTESAADVLKEDSTSSVSTLSTDELRDRSAPTAGAVDNSALGCKNDVLLPKAEITPAVTADSLPNCVTPASRSRRRVSRKTVSAAVASRSKLVASSDRASLSLSLQKYTQDGKIHLTAEVVKELEEALAVCGQTQQKVSLVRRAGPGRPPTKVNSRLSGFQKKVNLPPFHRFISGRSSRRSLFALERRTLTILARREGRWECAGFNYACKMTNVGWPYPCPRPFFYTAWRYRTQKLQSIAGASVQLRVLWACIRWDDIKAHVPPGGTNTVTTDLDITTTELLKKRDLPPHSLRSEYLVRKIIVPINVPAPATQSRGELYHKMRCQRCDLSLLSY